MRFPPMRLLKLTLFAALIVCEVSAQTPALQYDFFPLAKGLSWRYEYYSEVLTNVVDYYSSLKRHETLVIDSGIVQFKILDLYTYNDSTTAWLIEEYDSLKVRQHNRTYIAGQDTLSESDTLYWVVGFRTNTLLETMTERHKLRGFYNSHVKIWDFNSVAGTASLSRYSDSSQDQRIIATYSIHNTGTFWDTVYYRSADTSLYRLNLGLVEMSGYGDGILPLYTPAHETRTRRFTLQGPTITSVSETPTVAPPSDYSLHQNYPNPFNPATTIAFSVPRTSSIQLKIFDYLGREIATLIDEEKQPGSYTVHWDASRYSSGIYFCRLYAGSFIGTQKMILLK